MSLIPPRAAQSDLWTRLEAFDLDGAAPLSFSQRLARDNAWSLPLAGRVVLEYKKFLFLAATCGHPVTPSDEVDQAWHLHLVYTRSYWDELCGQVLGFPLHHGPTQGGAAEGHKFQDWYARTLQSYQAAFGSVPPADIWPAAARRFGEAPYFRRVNVRRHWLLPRPRWNVPGPRRGWLILTAALILMGCTARMPLNPFNWNGTEFLTLYWSLCLTAVPLSLWLRQRGRGPEEPLQLDDVPTTYELVRLAERGQRVADSALAALVHAGKLEMIAGGQINRTPAAPPDDPYELAIWNLVGQAGWLKVADVRRQAMAPTMGALSNLDEALESKGLLLAAAARRRLNRLPQLTLLALFLFGAVKLIVGLLRDRPVGFLLWTLAGLVFVYFYTKKQEAWATGHGVRLLRDVQAWVRQQQYVDTLAPETVALTMALFGPTGLNLVGLRDINQWLFPQRRSTADGSSGGDGGGDGGDGGGSGCGGGCGGCGGD